jgi:hypothetical protein
VRTLKPVPPNVTQILAGRHNSLRQYPHLEARLRQRVSPEELKAALSALLRHDQMDTEAAVRLFTMMAERFRSLVKFPAEAELGMSDEQYVRSVVDSVYRQSR